VVCIFLYFIKSSVECTLHLYIEFLIIFYFKVYQAVICSTVLSPVSLTCREKFIGGVVDAGEQSFGGVVDTAAILHFAYDYSIG
jgi:hypothetical protein